MIINLEFDPNIPFIIMLIEKNKTKYLMFCKVGKKIAYMPLDEFFDCLGGIKDDIVWWFFEMKDLIGGVPRNIYI